MKETWTWFTKEEIASWPEGHKKCRVCGEVRILDDFHNNPGQLMDKVSDCKECRKIKSKADWQKALDGDIRKIIFHRVKGRAKKNGVPFSITLDDIVIQDRCPVFGVEYKHGDTDWAPSLDRIDPTRGYIAGNVMVISNKANRMKSNASAQEVAQLAAFLKSVSAPLETLVAS